MSTAGRRRRWLAVVAVVAVVAAVVVLSDRWFWSPVGIDRPGPVDAIAILGGEPEVAPTTASLLRAGWAPAAVVSLPKPGQPCPSLPGVTIPLICFRPHPASTQGEARAIGVLARAHHWRSLMVVSGWSQTTRARVRVGRCFPGRILMVPSPPLPGLRSRLHDVVYEWGAFLKAELWQRSC